MPVEEPSAQAKASPWSTPLAAAPLAVGAALALTPFLSAAMALVIGAAVALLR